MIGECAGHRRTTLAASAAIALRLAPGPAGIDVCDTCHRWCFAQSRPGGLMAQAGSSQQEPVRQQAGERNDRLPVPQTKARVYVVAAGKLPVTEFLFNRAGAASPFGDNIRFPLPVSELSY